MEALQKLARGLAGVFLNWDVTPADQKQALEDLITDETWTLHKVGPDTAAGDLYTLGAAKAPCDLSIEEFMVVPAAALVASDAANATLTLGKSDGLGGAITPIATLQTNLASGNWVNEVYKNGVIVVTPARLVLKGQLLTIKKSITGAGVVVPACSINIRLRRI